MNGIQLVVGLGNFGPEYEATRHNAGFWWLEQACREFGVTLANENKFFGRVGRLKSDGHETWLLAPMTYMNASGRAVGALSRFHRILPEHILVVHDELDLPPGGVKLKRGGGHAGHNGLKDIVAHLGTPDFWRLRVGIGHPGDRDAVVDYVLHKPSREDGELIEKSIDISIGALSLLLAGEFEAAMLKLHTKK